MSASHELDPIETSIRDRLAARQDELVLELAELVAIPSGQGHVPGLDRDGGLERGEIIEDVDIVDMENTCTAASHCWWWWGG